ncbi:MAG: phosphotransferase [Actinobacteria bacterium]|nr:phosphotransferase [Actinomycetota bacterium]MBW3648934.1 phosphotransferase [Actinomycetota bacterium]
MAGQTALAQGMGLAEACRAGRLSAGLTTRLAPRWAGAWAELLDDLAGRRVLVLDHAPGLAPARLAEQAGEVAVVDDHADRARFRRALPDFRRGGVDVGTSRALLSGTSRWDLLVLDGIRLRAGLLERLTRGLAPEGRVVVIVDNATSALRALDRLGGGACGPAGALGMGLDGSLGRAGLVVRQRFALLRTSAAPVTAFDLDAPMAGAAVLRAAATMVGGARRRALRLLEPAPRRGALTRAAVLAPARMVIAGAAPAQRALPADRPTGRVGYQASHESKVVRGEPPTEVEKRYVSADAAEAEAAALAALAAAGLTVAPRLVARPGPDRVRMSWLGGRPLEVAALGERELETWVRRAARLLARIQLAVGADGEGRVLVHGDYWLGNLLHEGDRIVGAVDWASARRGDRTTDLVHLVDSLAEIRPVSAGMLRRLTAAAGEEHDGEARRALDGPPEDVTRR